MLRLLTTLAAAATIGVLVSSSASAASPGPLAGKRVLVVTERIDVPGRHESIPHTFVLDTNDRVYITRHEAEVVHTDLGTSDEVVFEGTFGNATVSRVQR